MGCFLIKIENFYQKTLSPSGGEKEKMKFFLSLPRLTGYKSHKFGF